MNFSELKAELYARGTDYLSEDAAGVARAARWLNQGYREILNLHAWPFLQATATGSDGAGLVVVNDLRRIRFVTDASDGGDPGRKLKRVSLDDLVAEDDANLSLTGRPEYYYLDGTSTIKSYPQGGTLRTYYIKRVDPMTGDSDEPVFDEEYHPLIVDLAMIRAYLDNDNFESAAALRNEVNLSLAAMGEDYLLDSREVQFIRVEPYDG
jgi:hypothetical protein